MSHSSSTRRALVTGASGAIGGAIARALAAQGLHVLAHANRNRAAADEVVAAIHATGGAEYELTALHGVWNHGRPTIFPAARGARRWAPTLPTGNG